MKVLFSALAILLALVACRGNSQEASPTVAPISAHPAPATASDAGVVAAAEGSGSAGSASDDSYTPGEFKAGMSRFKDVGVYLDGKPIGFLAFGELPITLKPTWVKHKVNIEKKIDCKDCPIWAWDEQRYYRFNDYLRAIGIDPKTVREIHIQGPKAANSIVATGRDLMQPKADDFMFFFGLDVRGKPIPHVPRRRARLSRRQARDDHQATRPRREASDHRR
jgi:hypothetical protein